MVLTDDNFLLYAMHHYDNPQCHSVQEFEEDLKRFLYLRKLLSRYRSNGELRERLILNHVIVLYNLFGDATTEMLFHKVDKNDWSILSTFLVYINRMPDEKLIDIGIDQNIASALRKL